MSQTILIRAIDSVLDSVPEQTIKTYENFERKQELLTIVPYLKNPSIYYHNPTSDIFVYWCKQALHYCFDIAEKVRQRHPIKKEQSSSSTDKAKQPSKPDSHSGLYSTPAIDEEQTPKAKPSVGRPRNGRSNWTRRRFIEICKEEPHKKLKDINKRLFGD